jgi:hypothetical protein
MTMTRSLMAKGILVASVWLGQTLACSTAAAIIFDVGIDTTARSGTAGALAIDLIPGHGANSNTLTIRDFTTDATLGAATAFGDVSGTISPGPAIIGEAQFLNDLQQEMTVGTFLRFRLDITTNGPFVPFSDEVSVFLLDANKAPVATSDPSGADALLLVDITTAGPKLRVFTSNAAPVRASGCPTDVDLNGTTDVATDVVYAARYLLGLAPVPPSFRALDPSIMSDALIAAGMATMGTMLDVDANGLVDVATDIVYLARYRLGLSPVPPSFRVLDPTIASDGAIATRIDALCPLPPR